MISIIEQDILYVLQQKHSPFGADEEDQLAKQHLFLFIFFIIGGQWITGQLLI